MKNHVALYGSAAAIVACGLIITRNSAQEAPSAIQAKSGVGQTEQSVAAHAVTPTEALAQAGTLWEPQAGNPREAERAAIQVAAAPLREALTAAPGTQVKLALSPRFAPLEATVTGSNTHDDGTITTFLRVEGTPTGTLTLQENVEAGFFLGQLYYDGDHPVAYEFRPQGDAIEVTRHAVSDLLCAELDAGHAKVDSAGLPSVEAIEGIENAKKSKKKKKSLSSAQGSSSISISDATLTEGDSGTTNLTFTVRLSQMNRKATTTVNFTTVDGSAIAGEDYLAKSGTVTFKPKSTQQTITIPVIGDLIQESSKTFTVQLSNPVNSTLGDSVAVGTIIDNDSAPTLSVSGTSVNEGNSGTTTASVAVTLSKAFTSSVTVNYATVNGTATAGSDYTSATGTLTFNPGETSKFVAVPITGDSDVESNETFTVNLSSASGASIATSQATVTIVNDDSTTSSSSSNVPLLSSVPGATAVIYLDMDGQVVSGTQWAGGGTINALGVDGTLSSAQMTEIWKRVSEDYAPFNVNVTTSEAAYLAAPTNRRIRCIITPTNSWYGNYGGVAYVNSFSWTGDTPCWVFAAPLGYNTRFISDAATHEIGHTMGLRHDGRTSPSEGYYQGHGSGEVSWAPIMGVGYYCNLVQWSKGEYAYANNTEDDLAIIAGSTNGFGYRGDAVGNTPAAATALTASGSTLAGSGVIETRTDVDVFSFSTVGGSVSLTVSGAADGQNLDVSVEILNASGQVVASANPDTMTDATVNATLAAGTYYLRVDGSGRATATSGGYSDYGSLGQYTIQGTAP